MKCRKCGTKLVHDTFLKPSEVQLDPDVFYRELKEDDKIHVYKCPNCRLEVYILFEG